MAVQAQYPANLLLLDRASSERSSNDMDLPPPSLLDQSPVFFSSDGGNANPRKRVREAAPTAIGVPIVFPAPPPAMIGISHPRSPAPPLTLVSTGLRLALDEQKHAQQQDSFLSGFVSQEVAAQINQQKDEIEQFLLAQREQLRRALIDRRHRHYRALLSVAEKSVNKRIREKEAEVELASRRSAELEEQLTRLRSDSMAWQSKAIAEQAAAASLHAQLQRVAAAAAATATAVEDCYGESPAEDALSAYVDPERAEAPCRMCRACFRRPATVVLIPCRHLCLCPACDFAGDGCPICGAVRTGGVQVFLS